MRTIQELALVHGAVEYINSSNSSKEKIRILEDIKENWEGANIITKALEYTYNEFRRYNVTAANVRKYTMDYLHRHPENHTVDIEWDELLDKLASGELRGRAALDVICFFLVERPAAQQNTFLDILDHNLKIRMDAKSINKVFPGLIPTFEVSLCKVFADYAGKVNFEKDQWLASRKLDGCRCIALFQEDGSLRFLSRQGKEFQTLTKLHDSLMCLGLKNMVLDGEICIVDENGNEDFKSIMKEITRKDHTIDHPMYKVFDVMDLHDFEFQTTTDTYATRYERLIGIINQYDDVTGPESKMVDLVNQVPIVNRGHFEMLFDEAEKRNWEGLVIRKANSTVICKRTSDMLKVKSFADTECVVVDVEVGPFRVIQDGRETTENVLTNFTVKYKGYDVSVGSGLSLEQRRYYRNHPEELIGKTVTIQYFEETTNEQGGISLRFPTLKYIYENGRNV